MVLSLVVVMIWIVVQILVTHIFRPKSIFLSATGLFVLSVPFYIGWYWTTSPTLSILPEDWSRSPLWLGIVNGLLVHILFYCTSMQFFYYVDRPLTLRILVELDRSPSGRLLASDFRHLYNLDDMLRYRLESMRVNCYVSQDSSGEYRLTPKGRRFAFLIQTLRQIFGVTYYLDARSNAAPEKGA